MISKLSLNCAIICCLILCLIVYAHAAEKVTVTARGDAELQNRTPEEARNAALERARANAVETACGVRVQSESFVQDSVLKSDFVHSLSYGNIVSEKIISWEHEVYQKAKDQPPQFSYVVTIRADIQMEGGGSDPSYFVDLKLNKQTYSSGDEMVMNIKVSKPSYINVLNFTADNKVVLVFPNLLRKDNYLENGKAFQIPSAKDREGVLKLQVTNLPGHKRDTEYIKVIATTSPLNLLDMLSTEGQYGIMDTVKMAATELARHVVRIPLNNRAEKTISYQVVSDSSPAR